MLALRLAAIIKRSILILIHLVPIQIIILITIIAMAVLEHILGVRKHLTVITRKPSPHPINNAIPPSALELRDHLNHIALMETQTRPVISLVVVQRAHVHDGLLLLRLRLRGVVVEAR